MDGPVSNGFNTPLGETSDVKKLLGSVAEQINDSEDLEFLSHEKRIGKYAAKGILGVGGQGICILAEDDDLKRTVVIKLYRKGLSGIRRRQILLEGQALAKIRNPHVAQCFGAENFQERPFLVLEYIDGQTLTEWVQDRVVTPDVALDIVRQLALGLQSVHENEILHLDLKPGNVIITKHGKAVLIDFGISQSVAESTHKSVAGSPSFLAPERLGNNSADPRSDIYGLGAILYFLLTNKAPVEGSSKSQVLGKLSGLSIDFQLLEKSGAPAQVIKICKDCLAWKPRDRFGSVDELLGFIRADSDLAPPQPNQNWRTWLGVFSIAIVLIAVWGWSDVFGPKSTPQPGSFVSNATGHDTDSETSDHAEATRAVGNQAIAFVKGSTESKPPQRNDFSLVTEVFKDDKQCELAWPFFLQIAQDGVASMKLTTEKDCYFYVFSFEFRSKNSEEIDTVKLLNDSSDGTRLITAGSSFTHELEPNSLTPENALEFLWIVATTQRIDPEQDIVKAIDLEYRPQSTPLAVASRLRGLKSDREKFQVSEAWVAYRIVPTQE